jgi:hypothetical protein
VQIPDVIPVTYSEDEAGYVSFRPVVRQTFRIHELLDMVLSVTGKDAARVRQILRSGTVVFHFYRYWWEGFEAGEADLAALLANFPDADPIREFRAQDCTLALVGGASTSVLLELDRPRASRRRLLRRRSFWDALLTVSASAPLVYSGYSYARRGDLYRMELTAESRESLVAAARSFAPRSLVRELGHLANATHIVFVCPRGGVR